MQHWSIRWHLQQNWWTDGQMYGRMDGQTNRTDRQTGQTNRWTRGGRTICVISLYNSSCDMCNKALKSCPWSAFYRILLILSPMSESLKSLHKIHVYRKNMRQKVFPRKLMWKTSNTILIPLFKVNRREWEEGVESDTGREGHGRWLRGL